MDSIAFKPSDVVVCAHVMPLLGSAFGRAEREIAAALLVRALAANGDAWAPVKKSALGDAVQVEILDVGGSMHHLKHNPFAPIPDFRDLVKRGFARWDGDLELGCPIAFTETGIAALAPFVRSANASEPRRG